MDTGDTDWGNWSGMDTVDDTAEDYQKADDVSSVVSGEGGKSDMYDNTSNAGHGDDYNFQFDENLDSYEEYSESQSDDEEDSRENYPDINTLEQSPYRFMNGKDGMATCERCGAVGIKHAFYSKSKRFCSLNCSKLAKDDDYEDYKDSKIPKKQIPMKRQKSGKLRLRQRCRKTAKNNTGTVRTFDWGAYLSDSHEEGASVSCFKHVPMSDIWENIGVGMKIETYNFDCDLPNSVYWIATVMKIAGYKALMRYEGFGNDFSKDFWVNICNKDIHPVGWCATSGKPLVPPKTIQHKYVDWKDYLLKRLTGARTLPSNFYTKVQESISGHKFKKGIQVEVVDRMCVSAMRVATIEEVIGGRLRLHYNDAKEEGDEFWCHMKSALLHSVGWAQHVGHKLHATQEYKNQCLGKITMQKYTSSDATPDMFSTPKTPPEGYKFQVGMKLEAIDPLNLSAICVATVMKVLKNNYLMIGIDGSIAQNGSDWFCYHATSPCVFPVGFCEVNGLNLTPPRGYNKPFKWYDYLKTTRSQAAPVKLFDKEIPKHGFKVGQKLEAVDLMEPRLICVATVAKVVGRLLRVHFDGWESEYDQWVDCESPDIYPVGWCEIMTYHIEGPRIRQEIQSPTISHHSKKRKGKTQIYKGPRKKRKPKNPLSPPPTFKPMGPQFDVMRQKLLGTHLEEAGDRPQEVPQSADPSTPDTSLVKSETKPVPTKLQNQNLSSTPSVRSSVTASLSASKPTTLVTKPGHTPGSTSQGIPGSTKSALLERINANTANNLNQNTLLAGHLTGAIPLKLNSGLVSTTQTQLPTSSPAILLTQSKPGPAQGQLATTSPALLLTQSKPGPQQAVPETQTLYLTQRQQTYSPEEWTKIDVCHFLKYNDCSSHVETFHRNNIDGKMFVNLTKEQIVSLTGMKVGSSLKIFELIQVLKSKMAQQRQQQQQVAKVTG